MQRAHAALSTFRGDKSGIAAIEFALIVPLMLTIVFGTIEVTNGVAVNRKVYMVSRTLSDLTSRATGVSTTDVTSFFTVGGAIMQPYASTPLNATISEIYIDPTTGTGRVQWSQGSAARAVGSTVTVPAGLIAKDSPSKISANQYLIYSEVNYLYTPAVGYVIKSGVTLSDSTFTRPRQNTCVYKPPLAANTSAPCPTS